MCLCSRNTLRELLFQRKDGVKISVQTSDGGAEGELGRIQRETCRRGENLSTIMEIKQKSGEVRAESTEMVHLQLHRSSRVKDGFSQTLG